MGRRDKLYTYGGANLADDGDYEADYSAGSRLMRLIMAKRGRWIGGRGRIIGSEIHNLEKMDEETVAEMPGMIEQAAEPLVAIGEVTDLEISSEIVGEREGALGNFVEYTDRTTGDGGKHPLPDNWKG